MIDEMLPGHLEDLARRAQRTGCAHTKFLTAAEAATAQAAFGARRDVAFQLDGGFPSAERQVAVFTQPDWGRCEREELLAGLRLEHRAQDAVRHPDVLGAALGLGLKREVLGDIFLPQPGLIYLVCLAPMAAYITENLATVGRVGVRVSREPLAALPGVAVILREKSATVASLRLDAIVAEAFNLSRTAAAEAIAAGRVQLAHSECLAPAKPVQPGQVVSLRGAGRIKLLAAGALTRKGRQRVTLGFFFTM